MVNSTVQDTSIKEDIGYEAIMGIIDRSIEREIKWEDVPRLEVIGLDEISLKKGHRDFVAIITGRMETETVILGVLPDRKKATVKTFLSSIPQRVRQTIHSVCTDMYEGFVNAAKEVFGKHVKIVIDRFHVAKLYRSGLDSLRKHKCKRFKQELLDFCVLGDGKPSHVAMTVCCLANQLAKISSALCPSLRVSRAYRII